MNEQTQQTKPKEKEYNFDIYGTESRFRNYEQRINNSAMLPENKEATISFKNKCYAAGLMSKKRLIKYESGLFYPLDKALKKPFTQAQREDIERVITEIKDRPDWKPNTKTDFIKMLKRYYKIVLLGADSLEYPDIVKGIRAGKDKQEPIKFEDMPTWEDAKLMAGHTKNLRDRTIIKVLWESGARIGELLTLKVGSVEDVEHGLYINIKESKTILRPVFLRLSEPDLLEWLSVHPLGNDKEAPLFCKMEDGDYTKALSQRYIYDLIMRLKQLCNITKKVNPHRLRHGSASYFSDFLSDSDMDSKFGWAIGSNIKKRYTHKNRKAVENKILKLAGIGEGIGSVNIYEENGKKQIKCFTCRELNDPERKVCHNCKRLLDISKAEQEQKLNKQIVRFIDSDQELKEKIIDHFSKKQEAGK